MAPAPRAPRSASSLTAYADAPKQALVRRFAALAVLSALLLGALPARADEADDAFAAAVRAEERLELAAALEGYRRAFALRPSAAFATRARMRADDLAEHAEGDFVPLATLLRVRRDPARASDPAELSRLFDAARGFPSGPVRAEALLLCAEAFGRRLKLPERAIAPARLLAEDASIPRQARGQGLTLLVEALEATGQADEARRVANANRDLVPALALRFARDARRVTMARIATSGLAVLLASALVALVLLVRRRAWSACRAVVRAPVSVLVTLLLAVGGAALARAFDEGVTLRPFVLLGVGILVVDRSVALVREARGSRGLALLVGLIGVLSVAVLSLSWSDPSFLESFGL